MLLCKTATDTTAIMATQQNNEHTSTKIDVEFVRKHKFPTDEKQLQEFVTVVDEYAKSVCAQLDHYPTSKDYSKKWAERLVTEWKTWATVGVHCEDKKYKSAVYWMTNGEGSFGIIQTLDGILASASRC